MRKLNLLLLLGIMVLLASCQQDKDPLGGDPVIDINTGAYQPVTKDSYWHYIQTGTDPLDDVIETRVTGEKWPVDNLIYHVYDVYPRAYGFETDLYAVKNHEYYYKTKELSYSGTNSYDITYVYMNDTAAVHDEWTYDAGVPGGIPARVKGTLVDKDINLSVIGVLFTNVALTKVELQYDIPGSGWTTTKTMNFSVAKNVGIVRLEIIGASTPTSTPYDNIQELLEFKIK